MGGSIFGGGGSPAPAPKPAQSNTQALQPVTPLVQDADAASGTGGEQGDSSTTSAASRRRAKAGSQQGSLFSDGSRNLLGG